MIVKKIFSFLSPVCPFLSTLKIFLSTKGKDKEKDFLKRYSELNTLNYDTYGYYSGFYETSLVLTLSTTLKQKTTKAHFKFEKIVLFNFFSREALQSLLGITIIAGS